MSRPRARRFSTPLTPTCARTHRTSGSNLERRMRESTCLADPGCAWGDQGDEPSCFSTSAKSSLMRLDARARVACYRALVRETRVAVAILVAATIGSYAADANATDGGDACAGRATEEACLVAGSSCYWGDRGAGAMCHDAGGPVDAQPGSGDPGGGGQAGAGADGEGCAISRGLNAGTSGLAAFSILALMTLARRRRAREGPPSAGSPRTAACRSSDRARPRALEVAHDGRVGDLAGAPDHEVLARFILHWRWPARCGPPSRRPRRCARNASV